MMKPALVALLFVWLAPAAWAETMTGRPDIPKIRVAGGLCSLNAVGGSTWVPGYFVSVDFPKNGRLSTTLETTSSHFVRELPYLHLSEDWGFGTMTYGVTFSSGPGPVRPYVRLLGGLASAGNADWGYILGLAVQPGAGMTVALGTRAAVVTGLDYRALHGVGISSGSGGQWSVRAGLSLAFGSRRQRSREGD